MIHKYVQGTYFVLLPSDCDLLTPEQIIYKSEVKVGSSAYYQQAISIPIFDSVKDLLAPDQAIEEVVNHLKKLPVPKRMTLHDINDLIREIKCSV